MAFHHIRQTLSRVDDNVIVVVFRDPFQQTGILDQQCATFTGDGWLPSHETGASLNTAVNQFYPAQLPSVLSCPDHLQHFRSRSVSDLPLPILMHQENHHERVPGGELFASLFRGREMLHLIPIFQGPVCPVLPTGVFGRNPKTPLQVHRVRVEERQIL